MFTHKPGPWHGSHDGTARLLIFLNLPQGDQMFFCRRQARRYIQQQPAAVCKEDINYSCILLHIHKTVTPMLSIRRHGFCFFFFCCCCCCCSLLLLLFGETSEHRIELTKEESFLQ